MRRGLALLALAAGCSPESEGPAPAPRATAAPDAPSAQPSGWFTDVTAAWGIDFLHDAGLTPEKHLPETMGSGAALADVDGDGDLDLYFVQSGPMRLPGPEPGTFRNPPLPLPTSRLYLNELDSTGRFRDATAHSGAAAYPGYGMGVAAGDANGDGHVDFFVTALGANALLLGDGRGRFDDGSAACGISDERWTTAATFFDAEGDGDLDLYVTGYVQIDLAQPLWCGGKAPGWRSICHPDAYAGLKDRFWRNRGDGTFEDATAAAGLADSSGKGLGVAAADLDLDGDLDLYTANDSVENRLWENLGDGTFRDATLVSGTGVDGRGSTEAGMGIAIGDLDLDLDLEILVTNLDDESCTLYQNRGGLLFRDATVQAGLEAPTLPWVGFGAVLADFDHDGDLDLALANGHIIDNIHLTHDGRSHRQRTQLFENDGRGRFRELRAEAGALTAEPFVGRGLYSGDLDLDGDLDLVLTQCGGPARVFRNDRARGGAVSLGGLPPGTPVELLLDDGRRLLRQAGPLISYLGACSPDAHAGLGGGALLEIRLRLAKGGTRAIEVDPPAREGRLWVDAAQGTVRRLASRSAR